MQGLKRARIYIFLLITFFVISILFFSVDKSYKIREIFDLRLTRYVLGIVTGISLSSNGTALQTIFLNPLAEPYLVGISGGALLGYSVAILLGYSNFLILSFFAFLGAILTTVIIYWFSTQRGFMDLKKLLLGGVIFNFFSYSTVLLVLTLKREGIEKILYLLWGSFGIIVTGRELEFIILGLFIVVVCAIVYFLFNRSFDVLSLGEEEAYSIGVNVDFMRKLTFVLSSISTGIIISIVGAIGFIGLISPHIARLLGARRHFDIFSVSILVGIILLLLADMSSRYLFPIEFPIGVLTSLIGVPFFFYILNKNGT